MRPAAIGLACVLALGCNADDHPSVTDGGPEAPDGGGPDSGPDSGQVASPCTLTSTFRLGPEGLAGLQVAADQGVIYATFGAPPGGFWMSATRTDGTVVTAPVHVDSDLPLPLTLAVRGDRVMAASALWVQALSLDGTAAAPTAALSCAGLCSNVRLSPGPTTQFRLSLTQACAPGHCTESSVLDRDGQPRTPLSYAGPGRITSSVTRANDVTTATTEHRFGAGACPGCPKTAVGQFRTDGLLAHGVGVPDGENMMSSGADVTDDGVQPYVAWRAEPLVPIDRKVRLARWSEAPGVVIGEVPGAGAARIAATGAGTGAIALAWDEGPTRLTRFRDQPGLVAIDLTGACDLPVLPLALVAVDVDHVVAVQRDGTAALYALAP